MKNTAPVEKNKMYSATINDIGETGMGIGKIDGFTVFADEQFGKYGGHRTD